MTVQLLEAFLAAIPHSPAQSTSLRNRKAGQSCLFYQAYSLALSISPGKPTILARAGGKALWGLPGHITSAMVVFHVIVQPFIEHTAGLRRPAAIRQLPARLSRNISSAQGRVDYVRVRLKEKDGKLWAEPILGKSGLINTLVRADGIIEIGINAEGLDRHSLVKVRPV